jgi:hypothetical protein
VIYNLAAGWPRTSLASVERRVEKDYVGVRWWGNRRAEILTSLRAIFRLLRSSTGRGEFAGASP